MERPKGRVLSDLLRSGVSVGLGVRIVAEVLDVLSYTHAAGVLHGDIKPSNIFVQDEGPVRITGFRASSTKPGGSAVGDTARLAGSPGYMAPEVIRGERFGPRSDLFSVGCVLFELVAGRPPFHLVNTDRVVDALRRSIDAEPDYDLLPSGPEWTGLRRVIERALRKQPDRRYADAGAMRADLETALRDLGI